MPELRMLCAGAAKGLVTALRPGFRDDEGVDVAGEFGAVGAMKDRLLAGESCDLIVLSAALIEELRVGGHVAHDSIAAIGWVGTGIAVRAGEALPVIGDGAALRRSLLAATAIFVPDPLRATAGIHFVDVLRRLAIHAEVAPRLRAFPNGAMAMRELAATGAPGMIGCTQVSEILYTPGVTLAGALPGEFALSTVYSVAVCTRAQQPEIARRFAQWLTGPRAAALRAQGGFAD
jgi:molybdate transport system substrate-binding protein